MGRYIDVDKAIEFLKIHKERGKKNFSILCADEDAIIRFLQKKCPTADVVESKQIEQIKWERDMAIKQLESYGVGFGEKADVVEVVRCKDCKYLEIKGCYGECGKALLGIVSPYDYCSKGVRREV